MAEEIMPEEVKWQVYSEVKGQYVFVKDKRVFQILFPVDAKLEENIEMAQEVAKVLTAALENTKKVEAEKPVEATVEKV